MHISFVMSMLLLKGMFYSLVPNREKNDVRFPNPGCKRAQSCSIVFKIHFAIKLFESRKSLP